MESLDGPIADWLRPDGKNLFDAPDAESAAKITYALAMGSIHHFSGSLVQPLANAYVLALWTARQNELIDADTWGGSFVNVWSAQRRQSLHTTIDLSQTETEAMFAALPDAFPWNQEITCRADLPKSIRLHRGIATPESINDFIGYSWTDDFDAARNYARRRAAQGNGAAHVVSATFGRSDIAALLEHRNIDDTLSHREWLIRPDAKPQNLERHKPPNPINDLLNRMAGTANILFMTP
jgi:hypothetical protein